MKFKVEDNYLHLFKFGEIRDFCGINWVCTDSNGNIFIPHFANDFMDLKTISIHEAVPNCTPNDNDTINFEGANDYITTTQSSFENIEEDLKRNSTCTARTFANREELMIALLKDERWEHNAIVCYYDKSRKIGDSFRAASDGVTELISSFWELCDGKTLWTKVEEKTELKPKKKTIQLAMFTCYDSRYDTWLPKEVCSTLDSFINKHNYNFYKNHHEIPNTRYEQEIEE